MSWSPKRPYHAFYRISAFAMRDFDHRPAFICSTITIESRHARDNYPALLFAFTRWLFCLQKFFFYNIRNHIPARIATIKVKILYIYIALLPIYLVNFAYVFPILTLLFVSILLSYRELSNELVMYCEQAWSFLIIYTVLWERKKRLFLHVERSWLFL